MVLAAMTKEQLKNLDATATTIGFTMEVMMERSGMVLAEFLSQKVIDGQTVLFLCGPGNNGGDGYAAARHVHQKGVPVSILLSEAPKTIAAKSNKKIVEHMGIPVKQWQKGFSFTPYDIIVDCLLGYGQNRAPEGVVAEIVIAAKESGKTCYACDLPTGIDGNTGNVHETYLPAKETLSLAAPKKGFCQEEACSACGKITIAGIGIPLFVYELIIPGGEFLIEGTTSYP